jgi:hypothetical protein
VTTGVRVALRGPGGEPVDLWRTLASHGFHDLAPFALDERARTLTTTLRVPRGAPRRVTITAAGAHAARVDIEGRPPSDAVRAAIVAGVRRVLHLQHDLSGFYALAAGDPELAWVTAGAGRMLRSPTVFEDVIKTLCTTNCSWSLTRTMVTALVTELGDPPAGVRDPRANAFPAPAALAAQDERFFRDVVRSGYRAPTSARSPRPSRTAPSTSNRSATPRATRCRTTRSSAGSSRCRGSARTPPPTS